jgi:hypothetical protein
MRPRGRRRAVLLATVAAVVACATPARAEQSSNVKVVGQIPYLTTAIALNFIGDTMFVSTTTGLYSYDVSNPASPRLLDVIPMYIYENEDMDVDPVRKRVFISRDPRGIAGTTALPYGAVHIIDVSNPSLMSQVSVFLLPSGHTTTCVNNCDFLWTGGPATGLGQPSDWGGRPVFATDIRDPANPRRCPDPIATGGNDGQTDYVHDVYVDALGVAWVSGRGGVRGYWTSGEHLNPLTGRVETATGCKPIPFAGGGTPDKATPSRFMHNAWRDARPAAPPVVKPRVRCRQKSREARRRCVAKRRRADARERAASAARIDRSDVLLATEEEITTACEISGRFVTYDLRGTYGGEGFRDPRRQMKVLDTWTPEDQPGATGCDSSHWFASRGDGITANAFYSQGVRFLDTSDPTDIRQVGYFVGDGANTWAAYWRKGLVFVADFGRGVDILSFTGSPGRAPTVRAPATQVRQRLRFSPTQFGGLCPIEAPRRAAGPR